MLILATTIWSSVFMWRSGPVFIYDIVLVRSLSSDRKFWEIQKPNCREIIEQIKDNLRHFSWNLKMRLSRFFLKFLVTIANEYSKSHFRVTTIEAVFYFFIFIDCLLVCGNFSILLRRVWNSAIIGGNYFLSTRFAMSSLQMLASIIPRQIIAYLYFR